MSDFINPAKTYKQYWKTQYCFRPMSSRRVNSVKELNRLTERIAELDKALDDICEQVAVLDTRNAELEAKLDKVREITDEMGEDTRLGNAAIGHGVTVVGSYLERLEAALEGEE